MTRLLSDANDIRDIQAQVTGLAISDFQQLFNMSLDLSPEAARNLLVDSLPQLVIAYGDIAASAGAEWFETLREREVGTGFQAVLAPSIEPVVVEESVRFSAAHLFTDSVDQMEKYLTGSIIKWVNAPAQETIINSIDADPIGYGWQRVVRPGGCDFCKMLADRGGVYTRKSVWFASHRSCNCGAVPSWDTSLPEVDVKAYEMSKRTASLKRRAAGEGLPEDWPEARKAQARSDAQKLLDENRTRIREWLQA